MAGDDQRGTFYRASSGSEDAGVLAMRMNNVDMTSTQQADQSHQSRWIDQSATAQVQALDTPRFELRRQGTVMTVRQGAERHGVSLFSQSSEETDRHPLGAPPL